MWKAGQSVALLNGDEITLVVAVETWQIHAVANHDVDDVICMHVEFDIKGKMNTIQRNMASTLWRMSKTCGAVFADQNVGVVDAVVL